MAEDSNLICKKIIIIKKRRKKNNDKNLHNNLYKLQILDLSVNWHFRGQDSNSDQLLKLRMYQ